MEHRRGLCHYPVDDRMTLGDLAKAILYDLGVYQPGEELSADDGAIVLARSNDWIDGLATERLTMFTETRTTWALTTAASYTIGTGATVNTARPTGPEVIANIGYQDTSVSPTLETMLGPCLSEDAYAALPQKALTGVFPVFWYYNPTFGATGFGTLSPWPIPTSTTLQGVIYAPTPISEFTALTTTVSLPPGYRRFFRTNLAVELAPAFAAAVTPQMQQAAMESKADIKRANYRLTDLSTDAALIFGRGVVYDINVGP